MKLPRSTQNWFTVIGAVVAVISLFMIVFLFIVSVLFDKGSSYVGVFIYIVLPAFLVIGLLMIPIGMIYKMKKLRKEHSEKTSLRWPSINLNEPKHRNAFLIFSVFSVIFLLLSAIGSYEGFHYTESVEFCGKLCHNVMKPEYVAYQHSPHARVTCVQCHVGPGADWYMRSKLSGLYQVYAVTVGNYPKPIPTPVSNLRPARETCEQCHWPQKFYSRQLVTEKRFLTNEKNEEYDVTLQMKIGPTYSALGLQEGIHWHINPNVKIEYKAEKNRETIPWVKYTDLSTGKSQIYQNEENELDDSTMQSLDTYTMDCIDCHNRPSHNYNSPPDFIDDALTSGDVPKSLPFIKQVAMNVLYQSFSTTDSALMSIEENVLKFYKDDHPEIFASMKPLIDSAIVGIQKGFLKNMFPEMGVRYDVYPDHIGHKESNGCFRCHSNTHVSESQKIISKDCNLCHTIVAQGSPDSLMTTSVQGSMEFIHPVDQGGAEKEFFCSECHKNPY